MVALSHSGLRPDLVSIADAAPIPAAAAVAIDPRCREIRRAHFPDQITFYAPGLKPYKTSEYSSHNAAEFVSVSVTGTACALSCEHCNMHVLRGMTALPESKRSMYELCADLALNGARGVLISGGCDKQGRVPLIPHIPDLIRARRELGLTIRVHVGLPDEQTCAALGEVGIDGAMIDVIGHGDTIREVYHLGAQPEDYATALANLVQHGVPTVPHIILGLHFGRMLGEWKALEMIARHPPKVLVLVILMPLSGTGMAACGVPSMEEIGGFFEAARKAMPSVPMMLGCARPLGEMKRGIDQMAIDAGLNGIAYPADGMMEYARRQELDVQVVNACCGVAW